MAVLDILRLDKRRITPIQLHLSEVQLNSVSEGTGVRFEFWFLVKSPIEPAAAPLGGWSTCRTRLVSVKKRKKGNIFPCCEDDELSSRCPVKYKKAFSWNTHKPATTMCQAKHTWGRPEFTTIRRESRTLLWYSTYSSKCSSFSLAELGPPGRPCSEEIGSTKPFTLLLMAKYKKPADKLDVLALTACFVFQGVIVRWYWLSANTGRARQNLCCKVWVTSDFSVLENLEWLCSHTAQPSHSGSGRQVFLCRFLRYICSATVLPSLAPDEFNVQRGSCTKVDENDISVHYTAGAIVAIHIHVCVSFFLSKWLVNLL